VINPEPVDTGWMSAEIRASGIRQALPAVPASARMSGVPVLPRLAGPLAIACLVVCGCTATSHFRGSAGTVVGCHDSAGQQARDRPPARLVSGIDGFVGDTNAYDVLPVWGRLDGHRYLAWKTGLAVAPGARPYRTLTVLRPSSARLVYGSRATVPAWRVRMSACGPRFTLYVGAILITRRACVTLAVTGPGARRKIVELPILVSRC
jgi:hypothetical protein